jgi:hypothetical protein
MYQYSSIYSHYLYELFLLLVRVELSRYFMCGSAAVSSRKVSHNQLYVCAAQFMQRLGLGSRDADPYCNNVL